MKAEPQHLMTAQMIPQQSAMKSLMSPQKSANRKVTTKHKETSTTRQRCDILWALTYNMRFGTIVDHDKRFFLSGATKKKLALTAIIKMAI